ncbi:sugar-binding transcriptional regulator [Limnochorda pilosa]|uniref:DeoR family transcriptional regulator n=1 Tax=Limnochorda pilosa TaxID=1555112 RepID=A0A0K2SLI6_LIMPI|nr:sugar-binding transcriptional regulator [Limnochorda pilosa]BAS27983.1 DeoR family transcriptional regulator [Limnochorda pilosa]
MERLYQAARLYYLERQSQAQIAVRLGVSRSRVSRLLQEAWEAGIVEVRIRYPHAGASQAAARELAHRFGLKCCVVAEAPAAGDASLLRRRIGQAAARYLQETLRDGQLVGLSWGTTLYETVNSLGQDVRRSITVVPLLGSVGQADPRYQVNDLAFRFAQAFGGAAMYLHAPAYTDTEKAAVEILRQRQAVQVAELWRALDVALVGIGPSVYHSPVLEVGGFTEEALLELLRQKAAGDVCTHFFDINGRPCSLEAGRRFVGIPLDVLRGLPLVIGVAGGPEKVAAIRTALVHGYVNGLVTDLRTAEALLAEPDGEPMDPAPSTPGGDA